MLSMIFNYKPNPNEHGVWQKIYSRKSWIDFLSEMDPKHARIRNSIISKFESFYEEGFTGTFLVKTKCNGAEWDGFYWNMIIRVGNNEWSYSFWDTMVFDSDSTYVVNHIGNIGDHE